MHVVVTQNEVVIQWYNSEPNQESINILPVFIQWLMTLFGYKYRNKEKPKGSIRRCIIFEWLILGRRSNALLTA